MKYKPLVSILLAVHNGENYIQEALESVVRQSYVNFELLVVDNASIDQTAQIVRTFVKDDNRVKYFYLSQKGKNDAYNYGYSQSNGDFICFFACDDMLSDESISLRVTAIADRDMHCSTCLMKSISNNRRYDGIIYPRKESQPNYSGGSILFPRQIAKMIFPIPTNLPNEDTWTALHLRSFGQVIHLQKVLYLYRIHDANSYGYVEDFDKRRKQFIQRMEAYSLFMNKWKNVNNDFIQNYVSSYVKALKLTAANKPISIVMVKGISTGEKLRFMMMTFKPLFTLRNHFFKLFSGINA